MSESFVAFRSSLDASSRGHCLLNVLKVLVSVNACALLGLWRMQSPETDMKESGAEALPKVGVRAASNSCLLCYQRSRQNGLMAQGGHGAHRAGDD